MVGTANPSDRASIVRVMEAATLTKRCTSCGTEVRLRLPGNLRSAARGWVGSIGVVCEPCEHRLDAEEKAEADAERRKALIGICGLPEELRGLSWADMDRSGERAAAVDTAKVWATADKPHGLVIAGPVGTGKTRLAATAVWHRLNRLASMRWISVPRLVVMANAGFGTDEKQQATRVLTGSGPLALDDIDKVTPSESIRSLLFVAIDNRVQAGQPLLVTTNLSSTEVQDKLGESLASRLVGYSSAAFLGGHDRRENPPPV